MPRPYTRSPCGIYGPRNLVLRHGRRLKSQLLGEEQGGVADELPALAPNQQQLFSFHAPSLEAGVYFMSVQQDIKSHATGENLDFPQPGHQPVSQRFEVVAPKFCLPDGAIHSSFPPQGHGALAKTLPHVVLADPHLPWARTASSKPDKASLDWQRNQVPWLALLVFTQDELALSADQLNGPGSLFSKTTLDRPVSLTQTQAVTMKAVDVPKLTSTISPITATLDDMSKDEIADVIFVPSDLFSELVTRYSTDGKQLSQQGPDVTRYKYLAHVRDINTAGMAEAGVEDNGVFGVVVSHRTGPLSNKQPQPVVAHLVSIEGVESEFMNQNWPIKSSYIALSSLHSWSFVTLPEGSFDMEKTLECLGRSVNVLRAPDSVINDLGDSTPMEDRLKRRLEDGFTLAKHRTPTGEVTAAIVRGPLTPTRVGYPLMPAAQGDRPMAWLSDSGTDLQVLDPEIGLMDTTYSMAWQLGRTLALADETFTAALVRLRTVIYQTAMSNAKAEVLRDRGAYKTRDETVHSLLDAMEKPNGLFKHGINHNPPVGSGSMAHRWQQRAAEPPDLSHHSLLLQDLFDKHAASTCKKLMASIDRDDSQRYDEHNTPVSTDWIVVLKWVLDRMFLYGIPAHYLIIDPSHLEPETLRFFHIDRNWIDALIDGALSFGKLISSTDKVRCCIQRMIHSHINETPPGSPPVRIPTYGFLMRSTAVTQYRDLKVSVRLSGVNETAPILRHDNLDVAKGVMLCLLDQLPGNPGLQSITLTQPPHQQSFVAAGELDSRHLKTLYKRILTLDGQAPDPTPWTTHEWIRQDSTTSQQPNNPPSDEGVLHADAVFKWSTQAGLDARTLLLPAWADDVNRVLNHFSAANSSGTDALYRDNVPNAAMVGIQLNGPIYQLIIGDAAIALDSTRRTTTAFPPVLESATPHPIPLRPTREPVVPKRSTTGEPSGQPTPQAASIELGLGHGNPFSPPPNSRPLRGAPPFVHSPREKPPHSPGAAPRYTVACKPLDNDPQRPGIPCGSTTPKDLVFSIAQSPLQSSSSYRLQSFTIELQLASGPASDSSWKECLLSDYAGPGPSMLSNVRFNVFGEIQNEEQTSRRKLVLCVIPRSTKGYALPQMCNEMSFILPVCMILKHDPSLPIPVRITLHYENVKAFSFEDRDVIQLQREQ